MTNYNRTEFGALVALDHNYAQMCPIRVMKVQKDPHASLLASINNHPRPKTKSRNFSTSALSDPGETLEEDDLVEYYSQWCDRAFSSDGFEKVQNSFEADSTRSRTSASFSFEYDSFESNNGDSGNSHRSASLPPNENNLNLLANCGLEQTNSKESSSLNDSNPSASPHSSKDSGEVDEPKMENDYQVLAAANALLQLSGNEKSISTLKTQNSSSSPTDRRKRKYSLGDQEIKDEQESRYEHAYPSMYDQPGTSAFYPFKGIKVHVPIIIDPSI